MLVQIQLVELISQVTELQVIQILIEFITIATTGNAADFGDMTSARYNHGGASSPTRAVFMGGFPFTNATNVIIDYVEIATTGNAVDFGDLTVVELLICWWCV